jgi:hypothetical protein
MGEYVVSYAERWLADKRPNDTVVLDDGSVWQVSPQSLEKTKLWIRFSNMEVSYDPGRLGDYQYVLVNKSYQQRASARFVGTVENPRTGRSRAA